MNNIAVCISVHALYQALINLSFNDLVSIPRFVEVVTYVLVEPPDEQDFYALSVNTLP